MESISASTKLGHHDSSDEEPNSPATKKPASGSPASGRDSTSMLTGTGRGDLPKTFTFCPDPPKAGGQGSFVREPHPKRPPDNEKRKAQIKPSKQSQELLKHIYKSWLTTTLSSGTVEVLEVTEKISNYLSQNIILLLYVCKKPYLNQIKYKYLNINQHFIIVAFMDMMVFAFLSKTTSSIVTFNFKLICRLWQFVLPSIIKHIL